MHTDIFGVLPYILKPQLEVVTSSFLPFFLQQKPKFLKAALIDFLAAQQSENSIDISPYIALSVLANSCTQQFPHSGDGGTIVLI